MLLIAQTIQEAKNRFRQNGFMLIFWGLITFAAMMGQFILLKLEYFQICWYPNFLFPLGAIYMFIYYWKKARRMPKTIIGGILAALGWTMGMNLMILGFFFSSRLGESIAPVFMIILAIFAVTAGASIRFRPLILGGIVLNLLAFSLFFVDWSYHSLVMAIGGLVSLVLPGIILNNEENREKDV